ncbi:MAG: hypothetical protein EA408_00315 [Marinilabiliales bacterium]|nr:MAG: hypothetical protein EA408_00315 [Marinilabiliales bacterium]
MDSNQDQLVIRLKEKIDTVVSLLEKSEEEREKLQKEKVQLTEQVKLKLTAFEELERKYESLKLAKAILGSGENSHDAKIKVNRIVREIDKCIALLNH